MTHPELTHRPSKLDQKAKALAAAGPKPGPRPSAARKLAYGLGWFSLGLGTLKLLTTRRVAQATGLRGHEALVRACGMREVASGVALLTARGPRTMSGSSWSRVAGDAMDIAMLGAALSRPQARGGHPVLALLAVAGVAALDTVCARALQQEARAARQRTDYSDRTGLRSPPEAMRGAALDTFRQPQDMRASPQRMDDVLH